MRTKRTIITFLTDVLPQLLIMFLGVFKSKIFLDNLDLNVYALYQLYSQLIGYLTMFEAGMTGAVLYRLFKPVVEKNYEKINSIISASKRIFNYIAFIVWGAGFLLAFLIPYLIKDNPFELNYIILTFMLYISTNAIFYFSATYRILMEAEQKKYINNLITQIFAIIKSILEIVLVLIGYDLISVLCVGIITTIISSIIITVICKKNNPKMNLKVEKDFSMMKDTKNIIVYKFAGLIGNNIDLIIISKFMSLFNVIIYSSYNFICNSIRQLSSKIYTSIIPGVGEMYASEKEKARSIFYEYNDFSFYLANSICTPLFLVLNNFINIWYEYKVPTSLIICVMFVINLYYNFIRQPLTVYTEAIGLYKETKISPFIEVVVNLSLSLIFVKHYGIQGVLFATFISYISSEFFLKPRIILKKLFNESPKYYYISCLKLSMIFIFLTVIEYYIINKLTIDSIIIWLISSLVIFIINILITTLIYKLIGNLSFSKRINHLVKNRRQEKNEKN